MAIDVHGLVPTDVLEQLGGVDTTRIEADDAENVTLQNVTDFIETGAGIMTAVFESVGSSVATPEAAKVWENGTIAYAKARVYERLNRMDAYKTAMEEHNRAKTDARRFPNSTGGIVGNQLSTNVDINDPFRKKFALRRAKSKDGGFKGW